MIEQEQTVTTTVSSENVWVDECFEVIFKSREIGGKTHFEGHFLCRTVIVKLPNFCRTSLT